MSGQGGESGTQSAQVLTTEVVNAVELVASFFIPTGTVVLAGETAAQLGNLIIGAAGAVPELEAAWNDAKALVGGDSTPPTAAQILADFNTASAANDALAKADAEVESGKPAT